MNSNTITKDTFCYYDPEISHEGKIDRRNSLYSRITRSKKDLTSIAVDYVPCISMLSKVLMVEDPECGEHFLNQKNSQLSENKRKSSYHRKIKREKLKVSY